MSKPFKLLLICFLSLSVLSFKNRLRQIPTDMAPPSYDQKNATAQGNATQLPADQVNASQLPQQPAQESNATKPQQGLESNATQVQVLDSNATQPQQGLISNASQPQQGLISNASQPQQGLEGNVFQPQQGLEGNASQSQQGLEGNASQSQQGLEGNATQPQFPEVQIQNISESAVIRPEQAIGAKTTSPLPSREQQISAVLPSTTVVNVDTPVVSVNGEAIGALQSDLIKIGILLENEGGKAGEALTQNQQRVDDLIAKLKDLGLKDENILNLGLKLNLKKKLRQSPSEALANQTGDNFANKTENNFTNPQLFATSQLEIQVNETALAGKVIDLLNSQNFEIKYLDYNFQPESLNYAISSLTENALADAERRARGSIANTGSQLGQLLNLNLEVDKDFQNRLNYSDENRQGLGLADTQGLKVIKVNVSVTYSLLRPAANPEDQAQLRKGGKKRAVQPSVPRREPATRV